MISALTHRLSDLQHVQKPGSTHHEGGENEHEHGVKIITLAGSNTGATMRSEMDEKSSLQGQLDDQEAAATYHIEAMSEGIDRVEEVKVDHIDSKPVMDTDNNEKRNPPTHALTLGLKNSKELFSLEKFSGEDEAN
ncbi:hypothetical protein F0562_007845 [Nyssa sinensis]|uniref:Uncharacterized protein n=1 Tax=Nyssa sinensis TaxID=561372 RepID=A0A5J5A4M5_9ASTE|nr:hypothetical protein F0562_007845 [Nyssa sinensis]